MSVLRELTLNHMSITPSMEGAQIESNINVLYEHFNHLMTALPQAAAGDVSLESSDYLSAIGYSTEASEGGKTLVQRIWQGIKAIFAKIKEFLGRLLSMRKHRLKGNEFKVEKLKKYIQAIDTSSKPEGEMQVGPSLLPGEPGHAVTAISAFRDQAKQVIAYRNHSLETLGAIDIKSLETKSAEDILKGIVKSGSVVKKGHGSAIFECTASSVDYSIDVSGNQTSIKTPAASVVMMNSLLTEYTNLTKDDGEFTKSIEGHVTSGDKLIAALEKMSDAHDWRHQAAPDNFDDFEAQTKKSTHVWKACRDLSMYIHQLQRLSHSVVWDCLYGDIEELLRKSLGQYKFKKHELMDEDIKNNPDAEGRRHREQQARDKQAAEKHRQEDRQRQAHQQAQDMHNMHYGPGR